MDEIEINAYLSKNEVTKDNFLGILAYDELPNIQPLGFYVVNTGHSSTIGKHWIVILKKDNSLEYFDSLANKPMYYSPDIEQYLYRSCQYYKMSLKRIQGSSNLCGNYCIIYSYLRYKKYTMEQILNMFSFNEEFNDILVKF